MKKNLTQGITDFKEFIDNDCYFVDKTHLIAHFINDPSKVHLITRPRRFGKTLNLSMIRYFFEALPPGGSSTDAPPNASLFDGMSITEHSRCGEYMGQYPVIHLSFKDAKGASFNECMEIIRNMLSMEYQRHEYLQNCGVLREADKELFSRVLNRNSSDNDCAQSIKYLSFWLKRAFGKPAYILLDEYDTPLMTAYMEEYYREMIAFIRSFMAQSFKDNPNLKQAVVVGILKVAQESIFSDFNNPKVSTLLNSAMKDCFGFTEDEVKNMASHFGLEGEMDGIRNWYNGYVFGGDTVIYNPWSIINYLSAPEDGLRPYWVHTSDNRLVRETLHLEKHESIEIVSRLLRNKEVRKEVYPHIAYPEIEKNPDAVWSFLLHSGYLKAADRQQHEYSQDYCLSIPNKEVHYVYNKIIKTWLDDEFQAREDFLAFIGGVREMNPRLIEMSLRAMLRALTSFHDMAGTGKGRRKSGEMFYHGLLLGLLAYLGGEYLVESNREYGTGRADILLVRRTAGEGWSDELVLFELKHEDAGGQTPLEQLSREALAQAVEKYRDSAMARWHPKRCLALGVSFRGKELALTHENQPSVAD